MATSDSTDRKKVVGDLNACDTAFTVSWFLAAAFLVLGIAGEVGQVNLGLQSASWFLLLIAALLNAIAFRMGWAVAWYLKTAK